MSSIEKLLKLINNLSKEELIILRDMIDKQLGENKFGNYVSSNDSDNISEYIKRFEY